MTKSLFNSVMRLVRPRWKIGILDTPLERLVEGAETQVRWVANPFHDRWFADPFVLSVDKNEVTMLVEDYRYTDNKGRISRIIVDLDRMSIVSCKSLLDNHHYSFPAILRKDGRIYVYPEQSRQGKLELFEYDKEKKVCTLVGTLMNEPLSDAVIYDNWLYATVGDDANGKTLISSNVPQTFKCPSDVQDAATQRSRTFGGSRQVHCVQDIETLNLEHGTSNQPKTYVFGECIARNAGDFFEVNGKVYRPAQECNRWYGNALSIQQFENGEFAEIRRIPGIHTINSYQGVTVVDKKVFLFKWLYWLCWKSDK